MDELTIGDKTYISSKKAAQITGYAKDYVGQLCRGGYVEARMVGRNWYVLEASIRSHRFGNETKKEQPVAAEGKITGANPAHEGWQAPAYVPQHAANVPSIPQIAPKSVVETRVLEDTAETLTDMQQAWKEWFARKEQTHLEPLLHEVSEEEVETEDENEIIEEDFTNVDSEEANTSPEFAPQAEEIPTPVSIHTLETEGRQEAYNVPVLVHETHEAREVRATSSESPVYSSSRVSTPVFDMAPAPVPLSSRNTEQLGHVLEERFVETPAQKRKQTRQKKGSAHTRGSSMLLSAALVALMFVAISITVLGTGFGDAYNYRTGAQYAAIHYLNGAAVYSAVTP